MAFATWRMSQLSCAPFERLGLDQAPDDCALDQIDCVASRKPVRGVEDHANRSERAQPVDGHTLDRRERSCRVTARDAGPASARNDHFGFGRRAGQAVERRCTQARGDTVPRQQLCCEAVFPVGSRRDREAIHARVHGFDESPPSEAVQLHRRQTRLTRLFRREVATLALASRDSSELVERIAAHDVLPGARATRPGKERGATDLRAPRVAPRGSVASLVDVSCTCATDVGQAGGGIARGRCGGGSRNMASPRPVRSLP